MEENEDRIYNLNFNYSLFFFFFLQIRHSNKRIFHKLLIRVVLLSRMSQS